MKCEESRRRPVRLSIMAIVLVAAEALMARTATDTSGRKPDYSKEAAVIESFRTAYRFENDGQSTQDVTVKVKIQSQAGVQQYGVLIFTYPSGSTQITIDYVRVRQPDGTVVATPPSSFQDLTPDVTLAAPEYSDFRQKHVAVKGLAPGTLLEYHVHFHTYAPLVPGQFWLSHNFTQNAIVLGEELEVNAPADRAVEVKSSSVQPQVTIEGNRRVYRWKTANLEPPKQRQYPMGKIPPPDVLLSSFQSWAQVGDWWRRLAQPQVAPTPEISAKAHELTNGLTTAEQKIQAIYTYVASQFRYISVSFGIGRYQPHAASQVLSNGYGDCKDKHALLASLLQAAGIEAWPALINFMSPIDSAVPSPGQFDHVITVVPEGKSIRWMDTTTELAPLGLLTFNLRGKQALVIPETQPAYLAATPAKASEPNRESFNAEGKLASDGTFTGTMHYTLNGDEALAMRLLFNNVAQSQWEKIVQGMMGMLGFGGTVSKVVVSPPQDTLHPFTLSFDYVRKNYSDWDRQKQIVPPLPMVAPPALPAGSQGPAQPFILGDPVESDYSASMGLPNGYTPALPKDLNLSTPFAAYNSVNSFKNGVLGVERRMSVASDQVPLPQLEDYRKFQKAVSADIQGYIVLNSGTGAAGWGASPSAKFTKAIQEAYAYGGMHDFHSALDAANRALKLDPNSEYAWMLAGSLHMALGEREDAKTALRKAILLAPSDIRPYQALARLLWANGRQDQIPQVWRGFVQRNPQNAQGYGILGSVLMDEGKYSEAVPEVESASKLDPKNWYFEYQLGDALSRTGDLPGAEAAYEKAVSLNPKPLTWNNASYGLAQARLKLPEAEQWATQAVKAQETRTESIKLDGLSDDDLQQMPTLAAYWDTLGWVDFREGKLEAARKYVAASYALEQLPSVADHLSQIDERLGRRRDALREEAMAMSLYPHPPLPGSSSPPASGSSARKAAAARKRLTRLAGAGAAFDGAVAKAPDELSALRSYRTSMAGLKTGSAQFFVLLVSGDQAAKVKFISGSEGLREASSRLASLHYNVPFPDKAPAKIIRRGIFQCSKLTRNCDLVLLLPDTVRSVE